jgi:multiple sugar transport system substrate-binding protein
MTAIDRRSFLIGTAALGALSFPARAQAPGGPLQVFAHRVHKTVAVSEQGGDVTAAWTQRTSVPVEWTTFDTGPLQERLFREASLNETSVDVGFVLNTQAVPRTTALFEPLGPFMARDPIEDLPDVFPGLVSGMTVQGNVLAVPFRHASSGLHWNSEILAERGFSGPPKTMEELVEIAKACTYRRADGTPCVGLAIPGLTYPNVIDIARAWDGDFITPDFKVVADQPGMMNAIRLLRDLFQAGALPRNLTALSTEDVATWMQQGRSAMALQSLGRNRIFNDPQKSRFPGKIMAGAVPIAAPLRDRFAVAPAKVEFWGLAIPRNAKRKELSWSFIKALLAKDATLKMALNGNGPVRASTYDDPKFRASVPYADAERDVLKVARVPLPAFDEAARAGDIFKEEAEAAVLGMKTPEAAMAAVVQRVKPLLPA